MSNTHADHAIATAFQFLDVIIGSHLSPELQRQGRELLQLWRDGADSRRHTRDMTKALINGGHASEIQSAKPRDNPYSDRMFRWAWQTGFDLGRRLDAAIAETQQYCRCLNEIVGILGLQGDDITTEKLLEEIRQLKRAASYSNYD